MFSKYPKGHNTTARKLHVLYIIDDHFFFKEGDRFPQVIFKIKYSTVIGIDLGY